MGAEARGLRHDAVGLGGVLLQSTTHLAPAVTGLLEPGRGGVTGSAFDPHTAPSLHGLYLGVVFSIGSYSGWEAAAPLAEETRRPTRTIPIVMVASLAAMGLFMVFSSWG